MVKCVGESGQECEEECEKECVGCTGGRGWKVAHSVDGNYGESDDCKESLEELLAIERTVNRFPNTGDDTDDDEAEDADEEAGLAHALATRTPGPKMRRGEVEPLHFGMGMGAGTNE